MGITRIGNVTGLDRIGIPVVMVCRPNSRSLAVSQGKGLTLEAARASGLMEAIEGFHAERITSALKLLSLEELRYTHRVADVAALPRTATSLFHPDLQILWIEGHDIIGDEAVWVPYELVHTNYTLPLPAGSGCFPLSSNGLASGNHLLEAISYAICEAVERDATTLWRLAPPEARARTCIDLETVDDPSCREVLVRFEQADVDLAVWDTTSDVGIPAFLCTIVDRDEAAGHPLYAASGAGCYPARGIALLRALTEAAQTRLTLIAGSRDDATRATYERSHQADPRHRAGAKPERRSALRSFRAVPTWNGETFDAEVSWEVSRLRSIGIERVIVVDLTRPEFRVPVVRVVIPGLEGSDQVPDWSGGARARARLAGAT